jgi:glycerophosphoryl diester phosphodiesterase
MAFAHRGGAAHRPENSWRAFAYAASLGYPYLETDARSTADGALVAFHDATLDRAPRWLASRRFIEDAHELGMQVHVWTLNNRPDIERALDLGADGVMTDEVDLLRDVLAERGQWNPRLARDGSDQPATAREEEAPNGILR